ncbi:hypothetical protein SAMN05428974_0421 [Sphingopyxis sp. YR583]|jgi:hypothetical protein|nr:hypothetical protein SAMN05428974_0421 [Sphingopyxis sp. YR583]
MGCMTGHEIEPRATRTSRAQDRIVDWLGAQGPLLLTIYMCAIVALIAFLADMASKV